MDGGAWQAAVHWVAIIRTRLSDFTFTFHFHTLEKEMATHSSVLALRIPRMGEPGGLQSVGSHRVGHNWSDSAAAAAVSKTGRQSILVVLSHLVYDVSFQQPQGANILLIYTTGKRFRAEMVEVDLQPVLSTLYQRILPKLHTYPDVQSLMWTTVVNFTSNDDQTVL